MAPSRPVLRSVTCVTALLGFALGGWCAEDVVADPAYKFRDLRFGLTSAPTPRVHSEALAGGNTFNYDSSKSRGGRATMTYLIGKVPPERTTSTVYGLQLSLGSYEVGDSGMTTGLVQPMVDVYYGWQYGIVESQSLRGWFEMMPFVGVGGSFVDVDEKKRLGYALETGVRLGAYLTERSWQFGVTSSGLLGTSKVKGNVNELTLNTSGFTFGAEVGYRF
jgi:hypothetical protein